MGRLVQDIRFAVRTFLRGRFVTVLAVLAFGLGIGVTAAVFSIFNAVLLNSVPYPNPSSLVLVNDTQPALATAPASFPKYHDWRDRNRVFSAMGGSTPRSLVLTGTGEAERLNGIRTTASLIDVLGTRPSLGRWFTEQEDQPGGPKVAVLAYTFWNRKWPGDASVLGRKLVLDGEPYEVIGVMPAEFTHRGGDVYVPLQMQIDPAQRGNHFLNVYARLKPGITVEQAAVEMRKAGEQLARELGHNHGVDVVSWHEAVVRGVRTPLRVLLGAVFLVLLIACANVANLLLASGLARRRELAIRLAIGARQSDLARQLTLESVILAVAGGVAGILLASWLIRTFSTMAAAVLPRANAIRIDNRVIAFTAILSLLVGLLCGLWPLIRLRTRELASAVRENDTRTGSGGGRTFGSGLVVAEIAIAFALFVGAGLLVKNLVMLLDRDTGMTIERVVSFDVAPAGPRYRDAGRTTAFYKEVIERIQGIGGLASVAAISHLPMYRFGWNGEMSIQGGNPWGPGEAPLVEYRWMAGDYFKTMGIRLLQGRLFDTRDVQGSQTVLVINKSMADKFWPGQDPIGKRVAQGTSNNWMEVVGVVSDVRSYGLVSNTPYELYYTIEQNPFNSMTIVMRTTADDPGAVVSAARQIVASIDPSLPVTGVQTMEQVVTASVGQPRLMSALTALFGLLAGLLAMVGIYGVTAYNVRSQRREFGIRLALGADPGSVQRLVVRRGVMAALAGLALGVVGALILTRVLESMLNDVKPTDPAVFAICGLLALLVSVLASYLPARAAGRVDPMLVLRE
jgi:predicted permease